MKLSASSANWSPDSSDVLLSIATLATANRRLTENVVSEAARCDRLTWELECAREVQQRLLPQSLLGISGLEYAARCRPAELVGGDFYDFFPMRGGLVGFAAGDVSGKGAPAALLMASLQACFRSLAVTHRSALAEIVFDLNRFVFANTPLNRYATMFAATYEPEKRILTYSLCGHPPPILIRGHQVLRLDKGGPPIGLLPVAEYQQESLTLQPDDTLVIFTDGMTESANAAGEEFGENCLIECVRQVQGYPADDLLDHLFQACDRFAGTTPQRDDMTLLILRCLRTPLN